MYFLSCAIIEHSFNVTGKSFMVIAYMHDVLIVLLIYSSKN
jgi:hypothetical protein